MITFEELFEEQVAASLDKQLRLYDLIVGLDWALDLDSGNISFGEDYTFPVQVLGSESEYSHTWLWSWANKVSDIPQQLLIAAGRLRELGTAENIAELVLPELRLDTIDGHQLSMVASGVCQYDGYYRGVYEGGAVFVLIQAPILRKEIELPALRMVNVFTQLISLYPLHHRRAWKAYLKFKGCQYDESGTNIQAKLTDGSRILAQFDDFGRLADISTTLHQAQID